jgi:hypothetical protein
MSRERFLPEYPRGMQIFEDTLEVAGVQYRKTQALGFAKGKQQFLYLEREPDNKHDSNTIRVIGHSKRFFSTKQWFLGYVPAEVAKRVVTRGFWGKVAARLRLIEVSEEGYIGIQFDLLGPKGQKRDYLLG